MANLLVTGGAGFIGGNFVHYWNAHHPEDDVIVLDALTYAGNRSTLEGSTSELVVGDIRDTALVEQLLRERGITTIVHFAAESHVDRSITGPDAFIDTNILGTNSLLKAARAVWLAGSGQPHRFHHISTDEMIRPSARSRPMPPTRPIRRARRPRTIWCAPITTPSGSM